MAKGSGSIVGLALVVSPSTPVDAGPRLSSIGSTGAEAKTAAGSATQARPDTGSGAQGPKPVAGLRVLRRMNADRVLASLQEPFRACYVGANSRSTGSAVLRVSTNGRGEVESVEVVASSGLPLGLVDCTARSVRSAKFGAPGGGGYSVLVPVVFAP